MLCLPQIFFQIRAQIISSNESNGSFVKKILYHRISEFQNRNFHPYKVSHVSEFTAQGNSALQSVHKPHSCSSINDPESTLVTYQYFSLSHPFQIHQVHVSFPITCAIWGGRRRRRRRRNGRRVVSDHRIGKNKKTQHTVAKYFIIYHAIYWSDPIQLYSTDINCIPKYVLFKPLNVIEYQSNVTRNTGLEPGTGAPEIYHTCAYTSRIWLPVGQQLQGQPLGNPGIESWD